jgi:DNA-directed RNA polymerase specialized sigma24 family protein
VGQCLEKLDSGPMQLIRRIAMQEYTQGEVAVRLRMPLNTVKRRYNRALDRLTELFLDKGLLQPKISCQGGGRG